MVFGSAAHKGIEERLLHGKDAEKEAYFYVQEELIDKFPGNKLRAETIEKKWDLVKKCLANFEERYYRDIMTQFSVDGADIASSVELKLEVPFRQGILTGVVDLIMPNGVFIDWKTGSRVPSDDTLIRDPQAGIYYYLAKQLNMRPPTTFEYVYLVGKNVARKRNDEGQDIADRANPKHLYSFQVRQDDAKITRLMAEYVNPLAEQLERGVLYKNPSDTNCAGCQFKTACWQTELPSAKEAREALVLDIISGITEEEE
jgi:CRISPR/Cas system-associated exonuclease Cas4 (RecB family)